MVNKYLYPVVTGLLFSSQVAVANETELVWGGAIKANLVADSNVSGAGANLPANAITKNGDGGVSLDTTLTRLNFGTSTKLENEEAINSFVSVDFNNNNDGSMSFRLREAYASWELGAGILLVGQTWSTIMDMRNVPESISEPVLSGVAFMRQPMVRWSQGNDSYAYHVAIESGTNQFVTDDELINDLDTSSSIPDIVAAFEKQHDSGWVRVSGLLNQAKVDTGYNTYKKMGYAIELSGGVQLSESDLFTLLYTQSEGNERYFIGVSGGPHFNSTQNDFEMRESKGAMASYVRDWKHDLRSTFAYGMIESDTISTVESSTIVKSSYGFANIYWSVRPQLRLGAEYVYGKSESYVGKELDNHRLFLGVDYRF